MRIFRRRQPTGTSITAVNTTVAQLRDVVTEDASRRWTVITDLVTKVQAQGDQVTALQREIAAVRSGNAAVQRDVAVMSQTLGFLVGGEQKRNTERQPVTPAWSVGKDRPRLYALPPLPELAGQDSENTLDSTGDDLAGQAPAAMGGAA